MEQAAGKFNCPRRGALQPLVSWVAAGAGSAARRDEFEGIAVALDVAGVEMSADHQH
jgi:hypothetical protein